VRRISLPFGVKLVGGGNFDLELAPDDEGIAFDNLLAKTIAIDSNQSFATLSDLEHYIRENRRRL